MKVFLFLTLCLVLIIPYSLYANPLVQESPKLSLERRLSDWPKWSLPGPFNRIALQTDIVYPSWFYGSWIVQSSDLKGNDNKPLKYQAKFKFNSSNDVIGDRSFNAMSIGKATLGARLLRVQDDPESPNRQVATFDDQIFLETKVIGRNQYLEDESVLLVDELVLQIFHNLDISRIKQVETFSKFEPCKESTPSLGQFSEQRICGEQWQAVYPGPGESLESKPINTSHYQLIFKRNS